MSADTFHRSLWAALSPAGPETPPLQGEAWTEVLVVGAGFLGLSLALRLAEGGVRATVLEAREVGFGASGRSTGFVVPSLRTMFGRTESRSLGETGERLAAFVGGSGTLVFDLVRRHGMDCSAEPTGWLQPAHTSAMLEVLRTRQADWRERGRELHILDAAETARRVGARGYHGALLDPEGGQIDPLAYARGLAAAAIAAGATVHGRSPVLRLERSRGRWLATTPGGSVAADRVVLATNALIGSLRRDVEASVVPILVHQVATERLSAALREEIVPGRSPVADTRRHTFAVRWSPDGRLVTGGLVTPGPGSLARAGRFFTRRLRSFFPQLGAVRAEFVWNGTIASTLDDRPRFMSVEPGIDALIGCNGRGIALATALGQAAADLYTGRLAAAEFPVPITGARPLAGRALARHGPGLWLTWSSLRDWLDARRA